MSTFTDQCVIKWRLSDLWCVVDGFENEVKNKVNGLYDASYTYEYECMILHLIAKCTVAAKEVVCLCSNGYPDGALIIARTIYEYMIIVVFVASRKNCPEITRITKHYYLDQEYRGLNIELLNYDEDLDEYRTLKEEIERFEQCIKNEMKECVVNKKKANKISNYWWTGFNSFRDLLQEGVWKYLSPNELYLFKSLQKLYRLACTFVHSDTLGNITRLGLESDNHIIDVNPTLNGQCYPLYLTVMSLIQVVGYSCDQFGIDSTAYLKVLTDLAKCYSDAL